jgi:hypothetical protein
LFHILITVFRRRYFFTEQDDLIFDVVLPIICLGLQDNAFKSWKICCLKDIYSLRVPPERHALEIEWKPGRLEQPIFRQAERHGMSIVTSDTEPYPYHTYLYWLQHNGFDCGFLQILTSYCIRRGVAESVKGTLLKTQVKSSD